MQPQKKVKNPRPSQLLLALGEEDATVVLRRLWLGYILRISPRHALAVGWFCTEPQRQWQGSSAVFREGGESQVWLRKGRAIQENQHTGEGQGDEGGSNISALRSALLTATSKGLAPHRLLRQAGLSPGHGGKPNSLLAKSSPF